MSSVNLPETSAPAKPLLSRVEAIPTPVAKLGVRPLGTSQPSFLDSLRRFKRAFERKAGRMATPMQFAAVGVSGMVVDLFTLFCLQWFLPYIFARALAIWVAMTWNFLLNRRLTFADARRTHPVRQYLFYCAGCLLGALGSGGTSVVLFEGTSFFHDHKMLSAIIGVGVGFVMNYCSARYIVFRVRPKTELAPAPESC